MLAAQGAVLQAGPADLQGLGTGLGGLLHHTQPGLEKAGGTFFLIVVKYTEPTSWHFNDF